MWSIRLPGGARGVRAALSSVALFIAFVCRAASQGQPPTAAADPECLPQDGGYVRARLAGVLTAEIDWNNEEVECLGAVRPTDGGVRMRFSGPDPDGGSGKLVLVFGVASLREGKDAKLAPVNVTVMREGKGEFYSTQGDDKCMLDEVRQTAIVGVPHRTRSYRVVARGSCTEPARAVRGKGAVLLSRFDFAGRVDFGAEDETTDDLLASGQRTADSEEATLSSRFRAPSSERKLRSDRQLSNRQLELP